MNKTATKGVIAGTLLFYLIPLLGSCEPMSIMGDVDAYMRVYGLAALQLMALVPAALLVAENPKTHNILRLVGTQLLLACNIFPGIPSMTDWSWLSLKIVWVSTLSAGVVLTLVSFALADGFKSAPARIAAIAGVLYFAAAQYLGLYFIYPTNVPQLIVLGHLMVLAALGADDAIHVSSKFNDAL